MDTAQNTKLFGDTRKTEKLQKDRQAWEAVRRINNNNDLCGESTARIGIVLISELFKVFEAIK